MLLTHKRLSNVWEGAGGDPPLPPQHARGAVRQHPAPIDAYSTLMTCLCVQKKLRSRGTTAVNLGTQTRANQRTAASSASTAAPVTRRQHPYRHPQAPSMTPVLPSEYPGAYSSTPDVLNSNSSSNLASATDPPAYGRYPVAFWCGLNRGNLRTRPMSNIGRATGSKHPSIYCQHAAYLCRSLKIINIVRHVPFWGHFL